MSGGLEGLYQEVILDHARRRVGAGSPEGWAHTHHEVNPTCGDEITVGAAVDGDRVRLVWEGRGCSISTASASAMSELLGDAEVFQGVARYVMRVKCAMLPWVALEAALAHAEASAA